MTSTRLRVPRPSLLLWAAGLALLAELGYPAAIAPIAHADATDDAFLAALKAKGIHFGSPEKALIAAHEVCDELSNGRTPVQVASTVQSNSNLDGYHAGYFIGASTRAYCRQFVS
ncbi:DUF732 domain-containing protein [Mycobacterium malmoense]|uniref:DUF732 domain-containing protein n=1 Tax=Mycobacterium malmoense TaxID=1780 RepID=UPI0008F8E421|nr:DUF732 domain-containing protein [Mycobacterium malmoense]OIN78173.1 hypothetical protein BMG05_24780 [Mycobacterium malmoense]